MNFTPKSLYGAVTLGVKIKICLDILGFSCGREIPDAYAQSNFKEDFFLDWAKKIFVKLLVPFVSVNNDFFKFSRF